MAHVQRRGNRGWVARYTGPDGRERSRSFDRKSDAERYLAAVESEKARGIWVDPALSRMAFSDWAERWWETTVHLRPSSRARSEGILRGHLLPRFGSRPLASITATDVRAFIAELAAGGMAPASVRKVYNVARSIFGAAEESGYIGRSPCLGVRLPKTSHAEPRFLSPAEVQRLADAIDERYRALVLLAGYSGLRFGELAGLLVRRVDFLRSRLTVVESIVEVAGHLHHGPTKTGPSRVVTLPRFVTEALAAHVAAHPSPEGFVFTAPEGGPLRRSLFRSRVWLPAVAVAGLEPLRMHDLRHTAASLAISVGAHPKAVAERLGHASVTTTLNVYGHLFAALDEQLAERLDGMARDPGAFLRRDGDGTETGRSAANR